MVRSMTLAPTSSNPKPALLPLPPHPDGLPWPTRFVAAEPISIHAWTATSSRSCWTEPSATPSRTTSSGRMPSSSCSTAPSSPSATAADVDPDRAFISWSMAKSITSCLVGILVRDGKLDVSRPIPVKEWPAGDPTAPHHHRPDAAHGGRSALPRGRAPRRRLGALLSGRRVRRHPDAVRYRQGRRRRLCRHPALSSRAGVALELQQRSQQPARTPRARDPRHRARPGCAPSCSASCSSASAWRPPTHASTPPATSSARAAATAARATSRASATSISATGSGTANASCPRAGSTIRARRSPQSDGIYGAHFWVVPGSLGLFYCSGAFGQRILISPKLDLVVVRLGVTAPRQGRGRRALLQGAGRRLQADGRMRIGAHALLRARYLP